MNVDQRAQSMQKEWIEYQCKSGQTLLLFNKMTGEHKWPHGLPEGIMYNNPASYMKKFATVATQTDDNGCNNGCMSMYVYTNPIHVSSTLSDIVVPQPSEDSLQSRKPSLMSNQRDKQKGVQNLVTANQSYPVKNVNDDVNEKTLRGANNPSFNQSIFADSEVSKDLEGMKFASQQSFVNDSGEITRNGNELGIGISNDGNLTYDGDKDEQADSNQLINVSRGELEEVVNVLENAERFSEDDMHDRSHNIYENVTVNDRFMPQPQLNNNANIEHVYEATSSQTQVNVIPREKQFECTYCHRKFTQKFNLKVHVRTHTGVKPFECSFCKKPFADKSSLAKHVRVHTGEKPFTCSFCEKKFRRRDTLNTHVKTHTGEKPFQCTLCNTKFAQRGNLKVHFKIHTGEKPFECSICKKKFSRKSTLKIHLGTSCFKRVDHHSII